MDKTTTEETTIKTYCGFCNKDRIKQVIRTKKGIELFCKQCCTATDLVGSEALKMYKPKIIEW